MTLHDIPLRCHCGAVRGTAIQMNGNIGNRIVCFCGDCQAFARFLGRSSAILDMRGGTDIFQLPLNSIVLTSGLDKVRCMRLSAKGMHRWYADCCKTPIGNTLGAGSPFIGLIRNFMAVGSSPDAVLGPVRGYIHPRFANGELPPEQQKLVNPPAMILRIVGKLLKWKLQGRNRPTPFFNSAGQPLSEPQILQADK